MKKAGLIKAVLLCLIPVFGPLICITYSDSRITGSPWIQGPCDPSPRGCGTLGGERIEWTRRATVSTLLWLVNVVAMLAPIIGIGIALRNHSFLHAWIWISVFVFGPLTSAPALVHANYAQKEAEKRRAEKEARTKPLNPNLWETVQNRLEQQAREFDEDNHT